MYRILKVFLYPFQLLYVAATQFRNHLYNIGYWKSFSYQTMVIGVGNLSLGGNGKTPMVEYLIRLLKDHYRVAILSRGYKRETNGYRVVNEQDDPTTVGDEPFQIYQKYGTQIKVAVGEQRALAIPSLLLDYPQTEVIVLDDAFQHRSVVPQLNILVTDFNRPFFRDSLLPLGRLREQRSGASRADVIMVTKCPETPNQELITKYREQIIRYAGNKPIFFSYTQYPPPVPVWPDNGGSAGQSVLLVTGIANSQPLLDSVSKQYASVDHLRYSDHHKYVVKDIDTIIRRFESILAHSKMILTTEKDMVKLKLFGDKLSHLPVYYQPIEFMPIAGSAAFDHLVLEKIKSINHEVL